MKKRILGFRADEFEKLLDLRAVQVQAVPEFRCLGIAELIDGDLTFNLLPRLKRWLLVLLRIDKSLLWEWPGDVALINCPVPQ